MVVFKIFYWHSFCNFINKFVLSFVCLLDSKAHLVRYKNIDAIAIFMSCI